MLFPAVNTQEKSPFLSGRLGDVVQSRLHCVYLYSVPTETSFFAWIDYIDISQDITLTVRCIYTHVFLL